MYFAILAYHAETVVQSWSAEEDAALMGELLSINDRLVADGSLGPAARLGPTAQAVTLRGKGDAPVADGPFAETKEQLLGFYVVDFPDMDGAIAAARASFRAPIRRPSTKSARSCSTCPAHRLEPVERNDGMGAALARQRPGTYMLAATGDAS